MVAGGQCGLLGGDLSGMGEQFVGNRFQFVPVVGDDQRVLRQIVEQGDRPRIDERQVVLQIGEGLALAQAAQIVAPGRQAVFSRKRFVGPYFHKATGGGRQHLARWGDDDAIRCAVAVGWAERALRGRVEIAYRLDLVAEQFDADGHLGRGGEDVDDAAATAELTRRLDDADRFVADVGPSGETLLHIQHLADAQDARRGDEPAFGQGLLQEGANRADHQKRSGGSGNQWVLPGNEARQHGQSSLAGSVAPRAAIVGQRGGFRQAQ